MPPKPTPKPQTGTQSTQSTPSTPSTSPKYNYGDFLTQSPIITVADEFITSTTTPTPLVNYINSISSLPFGISNIPNDPLGRRAIAKQDIPAGTTIICEETPLWVVSAATIQDFCHCCSAPMDNIAKPLMDQSGMYVFCSTQCQSRLNRISIIEAPIAANYQAIVESISIDIDLLRLAMRFLIQKYIHCLDSKLLADKTHDQIQTRGVQVNNDSGYLYSQSHLTNGLPRIQPTIDDIESLQGHFQFENDKGIILTSKTVIKTIFPTLVSLDRGQFLSTLYPLDKEYVTVSAKQEFYYQELEKDMLGITSRINANIHSLQTYKLDTKNGQQTETKSSQTGLKNQIKSDSQYETPYQYGMGLFPIGAMFNHSCAPNCSFLNQGNLLCTRTIVPIKKGEELFVNYIALNNDLLSRRYHLLQEKGFWCQCRRCNGEISHYEIIFPINHARANPVKPDNKTTLGNKPVVNKAAQQAKAALAAKQKLAAKVKPASASPTTTTTAKSIEVGPITEENHNRDQNSNPKPKPDDNIINEADLYVEKQTQMLFETFIGNSILTATLDKIERAGVVIESEAQLTHLRDYDLKQTIDVKAGHEVNKNTQDNAITVKKHILLLTQWYKNNVQIVPGHEIVEHLNLQCEQLTTLLIDSTNGFRLGYEKMFNAQNKNSTPEDQIDETVSINLLKEQSMAEFIGKINDIYPSGLEFPHFEPFSAKNGPPMMIDQFYPTLSTNLKFYPTQTTSSGSKSATSTQYRTYLILILQQVFSTMLNETLEAVQSDIKFSEKQQKVEQFASYLYATYPLSLHHNQYQIIVLLSNIMTALCPNVATGQGISFFVTKLLLIYNIMYQLSIYTLPSHFISFVEIGTMISKALIKGETILAKNTTGPNALVVRNLFKTSPNVIPLLKTNINKRVSAVLRVCFGVDHLLTKGLIE
jgi:hypothetical protein